MISGVKNKKAKAAKGPKQKMQLAKDPKQAVLAAVVIFLFIVTTIRNIVIYYQEQQVYSQPNQQEASKLAENQKKGLESLDKDSAMMASPGANENVSADADDIYSRTMKLKEEGASSSASGMPDQNAFPAQGQALQKGMNSPLDSEIEIMSSSKGKHISGKKVLIPVVASGRSNPFLPAGENIAVSSLPQFTILPPPDGGATNADAVSVMGTTISGILYDKYSPSAIITISGTDYLVKSGDVVNNYRVLAINKDQVVVQLGKNIYKAGVGQVLTEGQMNYNMISNLNKKFGGNEVSIHVKKKGY